MAVYASPQVRYRRVPYGAPGVLSPAPKPGIPKGADIDITGDTASAALDANAGTVSLDTAAVYVDGARVTVTLNVNPGDVSLEDSDIEIDGDTVVVWVNTNPGKVFAGSDTVPGDRFANPVPGSGPTGTIVTSSLGTLEDGEPVESGSGGDDITASIWVVYRAYVAGTLKVTGSTESSNYRLELFQGVATTFDELASEDEVNYTGGSSNAPELSVDCGPGEYLIRVGTFGALSVTLNWTFTPYTDDSTLGVYVLDPIVERSPAVLRAGVTGFSASESVYFEIVGQGLQLIFTTDQAGNIYKCSVPVPALYVGTYTLRAYTSSKSATVNFQILNDPSVAPPSPGSDVAPTTTTQPDPTVIKWVLQDPAPGGLGKYVLPINPESMSSPHAPRNVLVETLAAREGGKVIWESGYRAHEWTFTGAVLTQEHYDYMVGFLELNNRFFVVDHFERAWVVSFTSIDWERMHDRYNDWAWKYTVQAMVYTGPLTLE